MTIGLNEQLPLPLGQKLFFILKIYNLRSQYKDVLAV